MRAPGGGATVKDLLTREEACPFQAGTLAAAEWWYERGDRLPAGSAERQHCYAVAAMAHRTADIRLGRNVETRARKAERLAGYVARCKRMGLQ